jgi:predicted chitinase
VRTRHLQLVTSTHSVTTTVRSNVRSHFGPVNPASTTWLAQETLRANQLAQLSELLNSLENVVESLNYKSFTLYDTFNTAIEAVSAALSDIQTESAGTDVNGS